LLEGDGAYAFLDHDDFGPGPQVNLQASRPVQSSIGMGTKRDVHSAQKLIRDPLQAKDGRRQRQSTPTAVKAPDDTNVYIQSVNMWTEKLANDNHRLRDQLVSGP
jgi:hypothetical protein